MHRRRLIVALVTILALVAAACGDDDGDSATGDAETTTTAPADPDATTEGEDTEDGDAGDDAGDGEVAAELPPCPLDALDDADGPVEVVVWHSQTAEPGDTLEALAARYNDAQQRVQVRLESQGAGYSELKRKFQTALPSGDLPALIMFDDTSTLEMADSGVVLPGAACFAAAGMDLDDFSPVATSYYTIDGVLWPVSANLAGALLYYNRDHFTAAGLDPDDPPDTLVELREAAEAIAAAGVAERPFVHELASWKTEFWLTGAGSPIVDNDNGRGPGETLSATLADNPEALELFTWFDDMEEAGLLEPVASTDGQIDHYLALASERSSMTVDSTGAATSIEAFLAGQLDPEDIGNADVSPSGLDIAASEFPGLVPGNATQMGGAAWYLMNTTSPEVQAAAFDFMGFMNSTEAQVELLTGGSYVPWRPGVLDEPAVVDYFETSLAGEWLEIAAVQIDSIDPAFPGPLIGPYDPDVRDVIDDAHDSFMLDGGTPQDALDRAQAEIDELLEAYASF